MTQPLILFKIAGRRCALLARDVQAVIELKAITAVPRAPNYVIGLTALRSQTLTVLETRRLVGEQPDSFPTDTRAAVIEVEGYSYALQVDEIRDVGEMETQPEQIAGGFGANWQSFAEGVVETSEGPVLLLNASNFIAQCENSQRAA